MNPILAAAAWLILAGGPAPVQIPAPTEPQPPPLIECPAPQNHLTVRWVGDQRHHHHHPHRRGGPKAADRPLRHGPRRT